MCNACVELQFSGEAVDIAVCLSIGQRDADDVYVVSIMLIGNSIFVVIGISCN